MGAYIVRRLVAMVLMLIALSMIVFLIFNALPADPARLTCGKSCSPQIIEANRHRLGLDKPLVNQYSEFVTGIFVGRTYGSGTATFDCHVPCLGYSFRRGEQVTDLLWNRFPVTGQLALGGFILWIVAGVSSGIVAALRRGKWQDRAIMGFSLIGYSFPSFFIGLLLVFFIQIKWALIGFDGYVPLYEDPVGWFKGFILPWTSLALISAAFYARLTRNQMLETLGEDYIRTARSKGLRERTVIGKHALRAGLTPIVTAAGLDLATLLGGAVITERIFNLNGIGNLAIGSVLDSDLPVITGTVLLAATFVIVANLVVDILYAVIDPRVRLT
ncbi:MAG: ABC transporter permease [Sporichthyaceae bacterium]